MLVPLWLYYSMIALFITSHMCYNYVMKRMSDYTYHRGIKLRLYPSFRQISLIRRNSGCARFVYNRLIAIGNEIHDLKKCRIFSRPVKDRLDYLDTIFCDAKELKNSAPFLNGPGIDSDMVANEILNYRNAWRQYREVPGSHMPVFHRKSSECSYNTSNHYDYKRYKNIQGMREGSIRFEDSSHLVLPMLGRIRFKGSKKDVAALLSRTDETRIGSAGIGIDACGSCYVSLKLASDTPFYDALPATGKAAGIDLNLRNFLWDSDNVCVDNPKYRKNVSEKLAKAQRKLSVMTEHNIDHYDSRRRPVYRKPLQECRNYQKQRLRVAELHSRIRNQRKDFLYCTAKMEVKNHDFIFAEDLKVNNLLKNRRLADAISDVGWSEFLNILSWEAEKHGKLFMKVPPQNTTQTCSACGHVSSGNERITLNMEEWICPECGTYHVRDYNASRNILAKGMEILRQTCLYAV